MIWFFSANMSGVIVSPNYPKHYDNFLFWEYVGFIEVDEAFKIEMKFVDFDIEKNWTWTWWTNLTDTSAMPHCNGHIEKSSKCCHDRVVVLDSHECSYFCCRTLYSGCHAEINKTFYSKSNTVCVKMFTNEVVTAHGFKLLWKAVPKWNMVLNILDSNANQTSEILILFLAQRLAYSFKVM